MGRAKEKSLQIHVTSNFRPFCFNKESARTIWHTSKWGRFFWFYRKNRSWLEILNLVSREQMFLEIWVLAIFLSITIWLRKPTMLCDCPKTSVTEKSVIFSFDKPQKSQTSCFEHTSAVASTSPPPVSNSRRLIRDKSREFAINPSESCSHAFRSHDKTQLCAVRELFTSRILY